MAIGGGVELEWSIVYHSLLASGMTPAELKKRHAKLQPYSADIAKQAKDAVGKVMKFDKKLLKYAYHSDELNIVGNPEPKTDIVFKVPGKTYACSVKMRGPIQLASAEGKNTALMFERIVDTMTISGTEKANLKKIIADVKKVPTRLLSESNIDRIKKEKPQIAKEFIKGRSILQDKSYEYWVENNKTKLLGSILKFLEKNDDFYFNLIDEALTGKRVFGKNNLATANWMITPDYFKPIDKNYVKFIIPKVKIDVRAKSRGGITSLAFRFDVRK